MKRLRPLISRLEDLLQRQPHDLCAKQDARRQACGMVFHGRRQWQGGFQFVAANDIHDLDELTVDAKRLVCCAKSLRASSEED
jgi:hypothetical protein